MQTNATSANLSSLLMDSFSKPPCNGKENVLKRSNYHQGDQSQTSMSRSNSTSVLVIKALQNKIVDLTQQLSQVKGQLDDRDDQIATLKHSNQQLSTRCTQIETEHRNIIPILTKYQEDFQAMRQHKEQSLIEMQRNYEETLATNVKRLGEENQTLQSKTNKLQDEVAYLEEQLHTVNQELKRSQQQALKQKQEYLLRLDENDHHFETQIEHYQRQNAQLQQQLASYALSQQAEQQDLEQQKEQLLQRYEQLQQENEQIRQEYERQMRLMEEEVSSAFHDCRGRSHQLASECESLKAQIQQAQRDKFESLAIKEQETRQIVQNLEQQVQDMNDRLLLEQTKCQRLEQHLESIVGQIQQTRQLGIIDTQESYRETTQRDTGTTPRKTIESSYRQVSNSKYKDLLQAIVETEQRACSLNEEYQRLLDAITKGGRSAKGELHSIVEKIKQTNSELCDLKAKEFSLFSQQ